MAISHALSINAPGWRSARLKQPDHGANAFDAARADHFLGPAIGVLADRTGTPQQPLGAPFHAADLFGCDVGGMGAEAASRLLLDVNADLFQLLIEDPHQAAVPTHPYVLAAVFRRSRVIPAIHLDMAVAMHGVLAFVEEGEAFQGKRGQRGTLHAFKQLAHLLLGRAVNPQVGNGRLPAQQEVRSPLPGSRIGGPSRRSA